mmetsp:Transcript_62275/g.181935  ORF Transcript_62275/g.181935 Transcript_62275/m.181935 type:complete len:280 (-) Transcript_62275:164-1003(-)
MDARPEWCCLHWMAALAFSLELQPKFCQEAHNASKVRPAGTDKVVVQPHADELFLIRCHVCYLRERRSAHVIVRIQREAPGLAQLPCCDVAPFMRTKEHLRPWQTQDVAEDGNIRKATFMTHRLELVNRDPRQGGRVRQRSPRLKHMIRRRVGWRLRKPLQVGLLQASLAPTLDKHPQVALGRPPFLLNSLSGLRGIEVSQQGASIICLKADIRLGVAALHVVQQRHVRFRHAECHAVYLVVSAARSSNCKGWLHQRRATDTERHPPSLDYGGHMVQDA